MRANRTRRYFAAHIKKFPHLTVREKDVLIRRLKSVTLESIGKRYGVTEARIRQIEKEAIFKIRLKGYQLKLFKKNPDL
jgi:DNA-directed RNA polymerase sigma subunit (sigma70/sigma32)